MTGCGLTHIIIRHWRFYIQTRGRGLKMHDRRVHSVLLSRRGNPWLLCAFDIRGDEELTRLVCAFHFSHVIAKWKRARFYILHGSEVSLSPYRRENGASEITKKPRFSYSVRASAEHRRWASGKRRVGGRRTPRNLPRIRSKLFKIIPLSTPQSTALSTAQKTVRSLTTNIRIFMRDRVARNPAI
jgi:hypothetical protein